MTINHMMLQLRRTPEQEQALQQFIHDIHDPTSPLFHHWITAAEFGQRYGVAPADVARVTDWLESEGFKVNLVYTNQMVIDFTGSAGQIRQAFHTEIHRLLVNGQAHIANMSDPQIPAVLASTVAGVVSLNDFRPHSMLKTRANYTIGNGDYAVVPADLATIYNFKPAFAAGYSGQGQTIVLIEDADLYSTADWNTFRSTLGFASAYPLGSLTQVNPPTSPTNNCTDPGPNGDDIEATVDVEWASAGAPNAAIELASCSDTATNFGGFIALQNLLNASGTPPAIVSISYGESESLLGAAFNESISSLYQQAVTEGVSVFVSSGDEGGASTDAGQQYAQYGITVSGFTSTPYNVSVGGTDFADSYENINTTYWNSTNDSNYGSALSYVPEIPWNDSCASVLIADYLVFLPPYGPFGLCNNTSGITPNLLTVSSGSGGPSGCASGAPDYIGSVSGTCAGYGKPLWQSGLVGNPSDGARDIPDVSLFAADGGWGHYYVVCFSDPNNGGTSCSGTPNTWVGVGGTSVATPIWAAIQSLVNQASGSRWGNPNPAYYSLAETEYGSAGSTSCNSALGNAVATDCIFYDVTPIPLLYGGTGTGGDNDVPCVGMNCYDPSDPSLSYVGVLSAAPQSLTSAQVTNLGGGYTSAPSCTLSGGGGSGAACSAVTTGVVSSLTLTNGGSGYSTTTCALTGGGGTGASCVASLSAAGAVNGVFLTNFGSGYTSAPTCTIGGGGTAATCTATEAPGIAVSLTAPGSSYTTLPHCLLSGGGGTGGTCAALALSTSDDYQPTFSAATGWDFTSGIGTVNVANLVASLASSAVTLSRFSLTFGNQNLGTPSASQPVTLTNTGTASRTISGVTVGGTNAGDFATSADTCTGETVSPRSTCSVSVKFTPSAAGSRSASLIFTDNASNSPQTVSLNGTGIISVPVAGVSPPGLMFSSQNIGITSASQPVTLSNTGTAALAITGIAASGDFAQTNTCGTGIAQGTSCTINVTFTPEATGPLTGTLTITDNSNGVAGVTQSVSLSGTGTVLSLSPTSLNFGTQLVGSSSLKTVTLTNPGSTPLSILGLTVVSMAPLTPMGTKAGDFAIAASSCVPGSSVAGPGICTVSLAFKPTAAGVRSATLVITDSDPSSPQTVNLRGTGTAVSLSTASLSFGLQRVDTASAPKTVTLTNLGNTPLRIASLTLRGTDAGDFAIQSNSTCTVGSTVAGAGSCTINLAFEPAAAGVRSATLVISDSDPGSPQIVSLGGTGR